MQKFIIPAVLLSLYLSGCGMFSPVVTPEVKQYQMVLATTTIPSCKANPNAPILQVTNVKVFAPYDTRNMYYSESQYKLNSYAQSEWVTNPSFMVTQAMQQKLLETCSYSNVVSSEFMTTAKYRLVSQLMDFKQIINGDSASMNLNILVQLVDNSTNLVVKSKTFAETTPTTASPAGYVSGANDVMAAFLNDLATWLGGN